MYTKEQKSEYDRIRRENLTEEEKEYAREVSRISYAKNRDKQIARVEQIRQRRQAILKEIKLSRGCMDCGYNVHPDALEFDHRPDEVKLFELSAAHKFSAEKVEAEIAKCDVVCSNCHRVRTAKRRLK